MVAAQKLLLPLKIPCDFAQLKRSPAIAVGMSWSTKVLCASGAPPSLEQVCMSKDLCAPECVPAEQPSDKAPRGASCHAEKKHANEAILGPIVWPCLKRSAKARTIKVVRGTAAIPGILTSRRAVHGCPGDFPSLRDQLGLSHVSSPHSNTLAGQFILSFLSCLLFDSLLSSFSPPDCLLFSGALRKKSRQEFSDKLGNDMEVLKTLNQNIRLVVFP